MGEVIAACVRWSTKTIHLEQQHIPDCIFGVVWLRGYNNALPRFFACSTHRSVVDHVSSTAFGTHVFAALFHKDGFASIEFGDYERAEEAFFLGTDRRPGRYLHTKRLVMTRFCLTFGVNNNMKTVFDVCSFQCNKITLRIVSWPKFRDFFRPHLFLSFSRVVGMR
jgi:hypothetical protein